jgi:hypothetical protein
MKIKLFLLAICMFFTVFAASSCQQQDNWVPKGMKKITTGAVDYTMYVPDSWTVDISTGVVSAYVSATDRSNITMIAFNLENENASMSIADYWTKYEGELLQTFPDMKYTDINTTEETTATADTAAESVSNSKYVPVSIVLGGIAANKYIYTASVTGVTYEYMQVICIRGGIAYLFTYTVIPENFDNHIAEIDSILANFSFN